MNELAGLWAHRGNSVAGNSLCRLRHSLGMDRHMVGSTGVFPRLPWLISQSTCSEPKRDAFAHLPLV